MKNPRSTGFFVFVQKFFCSILLGNLSIPENRFSEPVELVTAVISLIEYIPNEINLGFWVILYTEGTKREENKNLYF